MNRKVYLSILTGIFAAAILTFAVLFVCLPDNAFSDTENRTLQTLPDPTPRQIADGRFESHFETYVSDQFPARDLWTRAHTAANRLMGQTRSGGVFLGKGDRLIEDFTPPKEEQYAALRDAVRTFAAENKELDIYACIVPTAVSILPETLPDLADAGDQNAYLDRLKTDMQAAGLHFVDLRHTFLMEKNATSLYYRTDHHWTTDAAYLAFKEYAAAAKRETTAVYEPMVVTRTFTGTLTAVSGFTLPVQDEIRVYVPENAVTQRISYIGEGKTVPTYYNTDALETRDKYALFLGGNHPQILIRTSSDQDRTLVILKDSYANCMIPFLGELYSKIIVIDPRYYADDLGTLLRGQKADDVLLLFNANTLAGDTTLPDVLAPKK